MGRIINPSAEKFKRALQSEIFVDKTSMISDINALVETEQMYICVSRPRRFGKTMAEEMLCAYYSYGLDSKALFSDLQIAGLPKWDRYLGSFDVVKIVITDYLKAQNISDIIKSITTAVIDEIKNTYNDISLQENPSIDQALDLAYRSTKRKFVILIDEWDALFREHNDDEQAQKIYLDFLRDWMKDKDYIALAYMTGILPIKKYGKHSALNMFDEYSMISQKALAPYTGFTTDEVSLLCKKYCMDYDEVSDWYDGYQIIGDIPKEKREAFRRGDYDGELLHLYAPLSVVNAMRTGHIENYWTRTETYEALKQYIQKDFDGLKETIAELMDGAHIKVDISGYQNDMNTFFSKDDILTMLIHLGYLGYDAIKKEVFIPNKEILDEFKTSTKTENWQTTFRTLSNSKKLLEATWAMDEETVAELIELAHDRSDNKSYNSEAALSYTIQLAYYHAQDYYTIIPELDTGKGYADITFIPTPEHTDKPAMIVELKYDKNIKTAIDQIHKRNYPDRLEHYKNNLLLIAINYDKDLDSTDPNYKHHSCTIEKFS